MKTVAKDIAIKIHGYRDSKDKYEHAVDMYKKNHAEVIQSLISIFERVFNQVGEYVNEGVGFTRSVENGEYNYLFNTTLITLRIKEDEINLPRAIIEIKPVSKNKTEEHFRLFYDNSFRWENERGQVVDDSYIANLIFTNMD